MRDGFDPSDWFWIVNGDDTKFYSSAAKAYVTRLPEDAGVTRIASEAELWDVLADQAPDFVPNINGAQDALKERQFSRSDIVSLRIAFNHENRIRALEGKNAVTMAQFKTAVKALL